uniref:RNA-directed DNA polymerase, eukaryota, reverse transcriptase zinc-binding domain protein n=1 Tax=Tanacetum cinerariifolium TaxID=118510 RepID=A0A6L2MML2_TANCI|nr:RNA-directed DNA polymerase, eukaryota, reverse transcriptase zinc-binding domain protein [Tanacetum cinerariifolium]
MMEFYDEGAKKKFQSNLAMKTWFSQIVQTSIDFNIDKRTNLFESFKVVYRGKVIWVRAKEVLGWVADFVEDIEEESDSDDDSYEGEIKSDSLQFSTASDVEGDSDVETVPESKFKEDPKKHTGDDASVGQNNVHYEDPFDIYDIFNKKRDTNKKDANPEDSSKLPRGFTLRDDVGAAKENLHVQLEKTRERVDHEAVGNSGGIFCVWDPNMFKKINDTVSDYFTMVRGMWVPNGKMLLIISVYAPQELIEKRMLLDYLSLVISIWEGEVAIMGNFNEVRDKRERFRSVFNRQGADNFNSFISSAGLVELIYLKDKIQMWSRLNKESSNSRKIKLKAELADLDLAIDKGDGEVIDVNRIHEVVRLLQDVEKIESLEVAQKAKIKWAIEESILIKKMIWNERLTKRRLKGRCEIVGIDKAPGPDGFTFGFYRRYWNLIESDVVDAISCFFQQWVIPKGGNSSFITLIPKVPNANMVKDFRPISLIGSLYKIIAKILANRLVTVLGTFANETRSALVADRQILDGLFILNELVQWCKKKKKKQAMIMIRVVDVGLFKGIVLSPSLSISHLFYADDAIFMGQLSQTNIDTITHVLDCYHRASGLCINMIKRKDCA